MSNFFERIAHSSWATWENRSWSLICHERPERFAHGHSFELSNLIDLLTVAHLSWAIWANPLQSLIWFEQSEQMGEWANERIPSPVIITYNKRRKTDKGRSYLLHNFGSKRITSAAKFSFSKFKNLAQYGKCKKIFSSKSLQPVGVWWASYIKNKQSFILQWNNGSTKIWLALPCLGEL